VIAASPLDVILDDVFLELKGFLRSQRVYVKLEGFNFAGSIKLKTALGLVDQLESAGQAVPGRTEFVESSSGNLGVAVALVCKVRGYKFICVSDPNISSSNASLIRKLGAELVIVRDRDISGGYLHTRIARVREFVAESPQRIWLNQYGNRANPDAHMKTTAPAIFGHFPDLDFLFVGAGTTGTLMGCAQYVRAHELRTKVIAVDAVGSVTFGGPGGRRHIPGLGTSRRPELLDESLLADVVIVPETETVEMCHLLLASYGICLGGSSGTVLAGVTRYAQRMREGSTIVAISPDLGDRYLETVYNTAWLRDLNLIREGARDG